jgi:hypothetical protein
MKLSFGKMAIIAVVTISTTTSILTQVTPSISAPNGPYDSLITPGTRPELFQASCPDPAAKEIKFEWIPANPIDRYELKITGVIHNRGQSVYKATGIQKAVYLYETGNGTPKLIGKTRFYDLEPGQEAKVSHYARRLDLERRSVHYEVVIANDNEALITRETNFRFNDCNLSNNRLKRDSSEAFTTYPLR